MIACSVSRSGRIEHRRMAPIPAVRAEEHQVVEHPVQLGRAIRSQTARSGNSMPINRSTASTTPSSLANADSQSCRSPAR